MSLLDSVRVKALPCICLSLCLGFCLAAFALVTSPVWAHSGKVDDCGGHLDQETGSYHVHVTLQMQACCDHGLSTDAMNDGDYRCPGPPSSLGWAIDPTWPKARVLRVVDGHSILVRLNQRAVLVRYIGLETPEADHPTRGSACFGPEAVAANRALVEGREVVLQYDAERRDRLGRTLAYVYLPDGTFVNARMVELGFAFAEKSPPNVFFADLFTALAQAARTAERGMWRVCR